MGLDPNDDSYPAGGECAVCVDELFGGNTPDCVIAIVQDIIPCFPEHAQFHTPPNGAWLLTQSAPCSWDKQLLDGTHFSWSLGLNHSAFLITFPGFFWFESNVLDNCYDAFSNDRECGEGPTIGEEGYVTVWWGPQICKPPCS